MSSKPDLFILKYLPLTYNSTILYPYNPLEAFRFVFLFLIQLPQTPLESKGCSKCWLKWCKSCLMSTLSLLEPLDNLLMWPWSERKVWLLMFFIILSTPSTYLLISEWMKFILNAMPPCPLSFFLFLSPNFTLFFLLICFYLQNVFIHGNIRCQIVRHLLCTRH